MNATFSFTVNSKQANTHLLACLLPAIPYLQPEQWQALLLSGQGDISGAINADAKGNVTVDGIIVYEDVLLLAGQVVSYTINDYEEAEVDDAWSLVWSNDEIAAIHKPANLPVNRTTRNVYNTLIQLLRRESPWPDAHLLHRLDLETSGLILIAKNNAVARQYQSKLDTLIKRKIYRAVVTGKPDWEKKDFTCDLATLDESQGGTAIRSQMHVLASGADKQKGEGKESRTLFKVLATNVKDGVSYSLIECELFSGRKHQIRAQLAYLGYPIVGDKIYSNGGEFYLKRLDKTLTQADHERLITPYHLLHAYEIHLFNLWQPKLQQPEPIIIRDDDFPESWGIIGF
ncbi:MAG: RluA family pseudouridine synthase [Oleispira sp.]|nr:RluA family pseudouridine synthase [Oleispira sp.]